MERRLYSIKFSIGAKAVKQSIQRSVQRTCNESMHTWDLNCTAPNAH